VAVIITARNLRRVAPALKCLVNAVTGQVDLGTGYATYRELRDVGFKVEPRWDIAACFGVPLRYLGKHG
jgi:hypothetical protein